MTTHTPPVAETQYYKLGTACWSTWYTLRMTLNTFQKETFTQMFTLVELGLAALKEGCLTQDLLYLLLARAFAEDALCIPFYMQEGRKRAP